MKQYTNLNPNCEKYLPQGLSLPKRNAKSFKDMAMDNGRPYGAPVYPSADVKGTLFISVT